ncbi:recombinase family protein [Streptococcus ratti]|uniref:Recombinase family protein n=1 Tax=Streptococcus ratti TaxID=1341 RepID=A0A7X9QGN1_STRRT|nr:recombinase family protein [Streptococcus ratti]NMD48265.1 recombinase family protein [Streptococcus ratti]
MVKIGYARVSSTDQNLARQLEQLEHVDSLFSDKESGGTLERPQLAAMLSYLREGDIVIVTELDRLGRNNKELTQVMNAIQSKGATLEVLGLPTLNGIQDDNLRLLLNNLILEIVKYQAEAERQKIKERQAQGIAIAKTQGKYQGRKALFSEDDSRLKHAFELYLSGLSDKDVAKLTGINERTFRRYREKHGIKRI